MKITKNYLKEIIKEELEAEGLPKSSPSVAVLRSGDDLIVRGRVAGISFKMTFNVNGGSPLYSGGEFHDLNDADKESFWDELKKNQDYVNFCAEADAKAIERYLARGGKLK